MLARHELIESLKTEYPDLAATEFRGQSRLLVGKNQLEGICRRLKNDHQFDYLVDITCVDYLHYRGATNRFGLVYLLANSEAAERITIRVMVDEPELSVSSLTGLWEGANWMEREVWDMFGVEFVGHPNLKRILMPEEFTAHPLRKDYPMQGRGERHNFPVITRSQA